MGTAKSLKPIKCENCPKILMFIDVKDGTISKDCPKCGHRNIIVIIDSVIQDKKIR